MEQSLSVKGETRSFLVTCLEGFTYSDCQLILVQYAKPHQKPHIAYLRFNYRKAHGIYISLIIKILFK